MLCHHRSTFTMATVWFCIVSMDYPSALAPQLKILQWQLYLAVVSNFSPSSQAWKERLKHWTYMCTFVAFHSFIHSFIYKYIYIYSWGVILSAWDTCWNMVIYRSWRLEKLAGKITLKSSQNLVSKCLWMPVRCSVNWATRAPALEQSIHGIHSLILRLDFW